MPAFRVVVATTSDVKKKAFETSAIAAYLRDVGVNYEFADCDGVGEGDDFAGSRWPQPFTASGGIFAAMQRISAIRKNMGNDDIVIAIESFITENAKDCVCVVVNYYVDGDKREVVAFSPSAYIASFPEKYIQHLAVIEKYQAGANGFKTTIGEVIENGVTRKNWHKLFNPFDRVEQIRETLNYMADDIKKIAGFLFNS